MIGEAPGPALSSWGDRVPPASAVIPLPTLVTRLSRSLRLSSFAGACGIAGMIVVYVAVAPATWILVLLGTAALHQAAIAGALLLCRRGAVARAAVVFCLSDWAVVLVAMAIIPACAPALVPIIIARVVSTLPYLGRRALLRLVAGSLVVGVIVGALSRVDLFGVTEELPPAVVTAFVVFFVPVGIAIVGLDLWQHSTSLLEATGKALTANADLRRSRQALAEQADELRRSRGRLVAVADLERRRVERDLHDGAQQTLIALCLRAHLLAERQPEASGVRTELRQLEEVAQEALTELRELAHGVYPPLLATQGLAPALAAAARRTKVAVRTEIEPIGRRAPEVEAAVYFCCREALQNLDKHAGSGATATLTLAGDWREVRFSVTDDGRGFQTAGHRTGQGTVNMRDRIAAVGGSLEIRSTLGQGTTVAGRVPASVTDDAVRAAPAVVGATR